MKIPPRFSLVTALTGFMTMLSLASEPVLVKNIYEGTSPEGSWPRNKVAVGNRMFMLATDPLHGEELWVSDGTSAGTQIVKDIQPGKSSAAIEGLVASGNKVYFCADDGIHGRELWVSDGTSNGTRLVKDLVTRPQMGMVSMIRPFRNGVIFAADSDSREPALWRSDGTAAGTSMVKVIFPDATEGAGNFYDRSWQAAGSNFYFFLDEPDGNSALWCTDGTPALTRKLRVFEGGSEGGDLWLLKGVDNTMYFTAYSEAAGLELWKSNGTAAGTVMVKDLVPGPEGSYPSSMVAIGNKGYFIMDEPLTGRKEIWVTDGSRSGTQSLTSTGSEASYYWEELAVAGNTLAARYVAMGGAGDYRTGVWSLNTKNRQGTLLYETANENYSVQKIACTATKIFFTLSDRGIGVSNGTVSGTQVLRSDFYVPYGAGFDLEPATAGELAFFSAELADTGLKLWKSDGTVSGTQVVKDIVVTEGNSNPKNLRTIGGHIYFAADDGVHGEELWRTDGTTAGTHLVADIRPGSQGSAPSWMTELNGIVYFAADDGIRGHELWRTDGTPQGTRLVKDLVAGTEPGTPEELIQFGGYLYFRARVAQNRGWELWRTNGTEAGTAIFANLSPNSGIYWGSLPRKFAVAEGWLYFMARSDAIGGVDAVFRTNGTPGNVAQVGSIKYVEDLVVRPPSPGAAVQPERSVVYFLGRTNYSSPYTLYRCSNGEDPIALQTFDSASNALKICGDQVLVHSKPYGGALWRSNGTPLGTVQLRAATSGSMLAGVTGEKIYYSLWNYEELTSELRCINLDGSGDIQVLKYHALVTFESLHTEGGIMYFSQTWANQASQLMRTRGTPETTLMIPGLRDRLPDTLWGSGGGYTPYNIQKLGDRLFFSGVADKGNELYSLSLGGGLQLAELQTDGSKKVLPADGVLDLGVRIPGQSRTVTLLLRNVGTRPLNGVTISAPSLADFTLTPLAIGTLAPDVEVPVTVTFTAGQTGGRETTVQISSMGDGAFNRDLVLKGRTMTAGSPPFIGPAPLSRLVFTGTPLVLRTQVASPTPLINCTWWRGSTSVGASPSLDLGAAALPHGGSYALLAVNSGGYTVSDLTYVGVISPAPSYVRANGKSLTLTSIARGPEGKISYQWLRDGSPVSNDDRIRGSRSATLKISNLQPSDAGDYDCIVTLAAPGGALSLNHGVTTVEFPEKPEILLSYIDLVNFVGEEINYAVEANVPGMLFTARGLPPGLKIGTDGIVTGRPTKPLPVDPATSMPKAYQVVLTARDPETGLSSDPVTLSWTILQAMQAGNYDGVIDRNGELDGGLELGSRVLFTVTSGGAVSGQLQHEGKKYPFTTPSVLEADISNLTATLQIVFKRDGGRSPLTLKLVKAPDVAAYSLYLSDEVTSASAEGLARANAFSAANPAVNHQGIHHLALEPDTGTAGQSGPWGMTCLTVNVSKTGSFVLAGKMADGTPVTSSGALCIPDSVRRHARMPGYDLHIDIYKGGGSLQGWFDANFSPGYDLLVDYSGIASWNKIALPESSPERNYKNGFPVQEMAVTGSQYRAPGSGELILSLDPGEDNAALSVYNYNERDQGIWRSFTITQGNKPVLPAPGPDTPFKTLVINTRQGTFSGTLVLTDENPTDPEHPWKRTATFQGVLLPTMQVAQGFCLVPELPDEPGETLANTPLRSCIVQFSRPWW